MERAQFTHFIGCVKKGCPTRDHVWHHVRLIRDWLGIDPDQADEDQQIEDAIESWVNRNVRLTASRKKKVAKAKVVAIARNAAADAAAQAYRDAEADWEPVDPEILRKEAAIEAAIEFADKAIETADLEE